MGKTWVAVQLIQALRRRGWAVRPIKPVESGCAEAHTLSDAERLRAAADLNTMETITRYSLDAALAPALAAQREGISFSLRELVEFCHQDGVRIVEGAGGWRVPLAADGEVQDLAAALGLPVLVVAEDRLGATNQVLLTCDAIAQTPNCHLGGVLLNAQAVEFEDVGNAEMLTERLGAVPLWRTCHECWLDEVHEEALLGAYGLLEEGADARIAGG